MPNRTYRSLALIACAVYSTSLAREAFAQAPASVPLSWGPLRAGREVVGFMSWLINASTGPGESDRRTVQVSVWYPARVDASSRPLTYGGYIDLPAPGRGDQPTPESAARARATFVSFLISNGAPAKQIERWLSGDVRAH